jgi:hypothetical protein
LSYKYEIVKRKRELFGMQTNNRIFFFVLFSVQSSVHVRVLNYKQIFGCISFIEERRLKKNKKGGEGGGSMGKLMRKRRLGRRTLLL